MEKIFLVTLVGEGVFGGKSIIGFLDSNDRIQIDKYIRSRYGISLGDVYQPKYTFEMGIHWEYQTSRDDIDVYVDVVYSL